MDGFHEGVGDLEFLGGFKELVLAQGGDARDLLVDLPHVVHGLHDVARARLALRADHGRAFGDAAQGFAEVARAADERHAELRLVDVVDVIGGREDFALVDVVDLDGLQDLRLDEMADAAFRHDRDGDGLLDALDHRGIAHARDAAGRADVGGDTLERHDGAGAGGLGDLRLLRRRDVHDDAALEHLGELLVEFILILLLVFCHLRQLLCMKGKAGPFPGEARFFASSMCFS